MIHQPNMDIVSALSRYFLLLSVLSLLPVATAYVNVMKQGVVHSNSTLENSAASVTSSISPSVRRTATISDVSEESGSESATAVVTTESAFTSTTEQALSTSSSTIASTASESAHVTTIFVTVSGSAIAQAISTIFTSSTDSSVSASSPTPTKASSSTSSSDNGDNGGGLSSSQSRIVIGVVVGVGGAIVLGIVAYIISRIYLRKRHRDTSRTSPYGTARLAMSEEDTADPFRSNSDRYHQPNQAANF
ncbi:hypothetical protein V1507DRAFT_452046 [Lipomyces tetrasporus]